MVTVDRNNMNEDITNDEFDDVTRHEHREKAKAANKPAIDHLPDAVKKDEFGMLTLLAKPGEKIIIERVASILSNKPWLDTKTYVINTIDAASGDVNLWDDDLKRFAQTNYIKGTQVGYRFKLANQKGLQIGKKKRGRPKKNATGIPELIKPVVLDINGLPVKLKRGRPPGIKNRDKETIKTEKRAKLDLRMLKKAKKNKK